MTYLSKITQGRDIEILIRRRILIIRFVLLSFLIILLLVVLLSLL